ncbi:MAG: twin-arginine translocase TatA/TatE family subunit [Archangium sp.]|nr:twin-arginine translocase TatA/TatE family subunit [Archangium sp.]
MGGIGTGEIIMLVVIILIVFSASRMSALGNAIGRFVYSFKKASAGDGFIDVKPTTPPPAAKQFERGSVEGEIIKPPSDPKN